MAGPSEVTVEIVTTSQVIPNSTDPASPPTITMNGNPLPAPGAPPATATGWQLVVIDSTMDMTDPASIRFNSYLAVLPDSNGNWNDTYQWVYEGMVTQILCSGDLQTQLVFLASYGLDANQPPTSDALRQMLSYGAGAQLQGWEKSVDTGSESSDWTSFPACYVMVGGSSYDYGLGSEVFENPGTDQVKATLTVTLGNPVPPS
jgi:hypothetical protein